MMDGSEARRLEALRRYEILDTPPEPNFDRITALAATIFEHPVCTLALADVERHWFKSRRGVDGREMPRRLSFCDETIRGTGVFVVEDASADRRFADAPVVASQPHIRFYAGAPLVTPAGERIGSLCVLDTQPQSGFADKKRTILTDLASTAVELLEARARQIELARCTKDIAHLARHDALTGLPNRRAFLDRAGPVLAGAGRGREAALLYLDLDGFKQVNDTFGHLGGDALLRDMAKRLRTLLPEGASAARLGGDEFVVLLAPAADAAEAAGRLAGRLVDRIGRPYRLGERQAEVGVSIGIACGGEEAGIDALLRRADAALYTAKVAGRGRYALAPLLEGVPF